jgi:serine/threonine protein kinase
MSVETAPAPNERIGTVLSGRYRLERLIGAGGEGAVYEAIDTAGGRFAIKMLFDVSGHDDRSAKLARFAREARIMSTLSNPNLAKVFDSGVDARSGAQYLVMELLSGADLDAWLRKHGPVDPSLAARILIQAAVGVSSAHRAGIIHRDIKPSNLFLHRAGSDQIIVKVCDFGIAKDLFSEALTQSGGLMGSPLYMSPEQASDTKRVDGRADVWSLGATLYATLSGAAPFHGVSSISELLFAITSKDIPPLQEVAPWVSGPIASIVHGALVRELGARCPDVDAFAEALRPHAGGEARIETNMLAPLASKVADTSAVRVAIPRSWREAVENSPSAQTTDPPDDPAALLVGRTLSGRYPLLRVIGRGGMGAVYETRGRDGERLAIKVILEELYRRKPEALHRFVREAHAVMSIHSEHVVRVRDADTDAAQKTPYLVMDMLEGRDLATRIRQGGPLESGPAARIFIQACRGLAAAHALGIVHRDIKPANIFLQERPSGEIAAVICDFGVAKQVVTIDDDMTAMDLTKTGGVIGSPLYLSPEQAKNAKNVDRRTDIWSLAITLYEACSGRKAWESCSSVGEVILAVCTQDVPPLSTAAPWLSPQFAAVVHRGLRRDPAERYSSIEEFAAALEPFASRSPLTREALLAAPDVTSFRAHATTVGGSDTTVSVTRTIGTPSSHERGLERAPDPAAARESAAVRAANDAPRSRTRFVAVASVPLALAVALGGGVWAVKRAGHAGWSTPSRAAQAALPPSDAPPTAALPGPELPPASTLPAIESVEHVAAPPSATATSSSSAKRPVGRPRPPRPVESHSEPPPPPPDAFDRRR